MRAGDDVQSFIETFETVAEACGWPAGEWAFRETTMGPDDRPFAYAQRLRDATMRCLQPGSTIGSQAVA